MCAHFFFFFFFFFPFPVARARIQASQQLSCSLVRLPEMSRSMETQAQFNSQRSPSTKGHTGEKRQTELLENTALADYRIKEACQLHGQGIWHMAACFDCQRNSFFIARQKKKKEEEKEYGREVFSCLWCLHYQGIKSNQIIQDLLRAYLHSLQDHILKRISVLLKIVSQEIKNLGAKLVANCGLSMINQLHYL